MKTAVLEYIYVLLGTIFIALYLWFISGDDLLASQAKHLFESAQEYEQLARDVKSGEVEISGEKGAFVFERLAADYTAQGEIAENYNYFLRTGIKIVLGIALFQCIVLYGVHRAQKKCNK